MEYYSGFSSRNSCLALYLINEFVSIYVIMRMNGIPLHPFPKAIMSKNPIKSAITYITTREILGPSLF